MTTNELSWLNWDSADWDLLEFCRELVAFRYAHPVFRRRRFFEGRPIFGSELSDIGWFRPDGAEMSPADWDTGFAKSLGVFLNGDALPDPDPRGHRVGDDTFLLLFNAHHESMAFTPPGGRWGQLWTTVVDTVGRPGRQSHAAGDALAVAGRSLSVLRRV